MILQGGIFPNRYEVGIENQGVWEFPTAHEAEDFIASVIGGPLSEGEDPENALNAWSISHDLMSYYNIYEIEDD